jgi:vacuolar-type H+-ATPase subunit E/Vma4
MTIKAMNVTLGATIDTIGGILAEDNNGTREIDLTFEELLRTHEDEVKSFLLERIIK